MGCGAGFGAGRGEVRVDFVVGEDGGLGFEDLHGWLVVGGGSGSGEMILGEVGSIMWLE